MGEPERPGGKLALGLVLFGALVLVRRALGLPTARRNRRRSVGRAALAAGHETSDVHIGGIVATGVGLLVTLAVVFAAVSWLQTRFTGRALPLAPPAARATPAAPPLPPDPRLEAVAGQELHELRAAQERLLHGYDWIDRPAGIARIPIERAIDLLAERGLPARPDSEGDAFRDRGLGTPSDPSSGRTAEAARP